LPRLVTETFAIRDDVVRQLALVGRALLHTLGQAPREARHRDRDPVPRRAAPLFGKAQEDLAPNQLVIRIQPDEGITLRVAAKVPGQVTRIRDVNMDFRYGASFGVQLAEAYERLILDCILGDSTLYARKDMTERGWELVMPILDEWAAHKDDADFPNYEAGSLGAGRVL
jgi:glucose-6-phosphate 1-dehydrogenase